jgi:hypothetical protein
MVNRPFSRVSEIYVLLNQVESRTLRFRNRILLTSPSVTNVYRSLTHIESILKQEESFKKILGRSNTG